MQSHATTGGMLINALKSKMMSVFMYDEQRQTVLRGGELLKELDELKFFNQRSSRTGRAPKKYEALLTLRVSQSLACNHFFGRGGK